MSNLSKFQQSLKTNIVDLRKPLIWIKSFDFGYMIDAIKSSVDYSGWIWRASGNEVRDLKTGKIYNFSGLNKEDLTLGMYISLLKNYNFKLLIAQVSESYCENNFQFIPCLQDFVYINNKLPDKEKKTVILISNNSFEISGLEHICEHLEMPLPDYEDIDLEFGLIQDNELKTLRDHDSTIKLHNDKIIYLGNKKITNKREEDGKGNGYYYLHDNDKGIIRRDETGRVKRIIFPRTPKYGFSNDLLVGDRDKKTVFEDYYQELTDSLYGMHLYDIKELLKSLTCKYNIIMPYYENENDKFVTITERIIEQKKQLVRNSGLIEVIDLKNKSKYHERVGGIDYLRLYLQGKAKLISNPSFMLSKLPKPKGILLVGTAGCGKSESAKATASILDLPLYRLNIGDLLGHKYGQSENRFNEALRIADASAPCVLWVDEIEKAFAGAGNEQENDDTMTHIIGRFLTWMQEHETMVYLVATANNLLKMRPELLRKGRWDEIFFLTYPEREGRKQIICQKLKEFHLNIKDKEGKILKAENISDDVLSDILSRTEGMSGAEVASIIVDIVTPLYEHQKEDFLEIIKVVDINHIEEYLNRFWSMGKKDSDKKEAKGIERELADKIENELLDIKIRNGGELGKEKEDELRKLLTIKYKKQLNKYKLASTGKYIL